MKRILIFLSVFVFSLFSFKKSKGVNETPDTYRRKHVNERINNIRAVIKEKAANGEPLDFGKYTEDIVQWGNYWTNWNNWNNWRNWSNFQNWMNY